MTVEIIMTVLGVLSIIYGIFIFSLQTGANTFLLWFGLGGCLIVAAALVHKGIWMNIPAGMRMLVTAILVVGLASFVLIEGCIVSGFFAKGQDDLDYIIVLGAQVKKNGPSPVLKYRLDAAYDYLMENEKTACIVSGGQGVNEPVSEAQGMRDYLVRKRGLDERRIIMEDQSLTTTQNLLNSKDFLTEDSTVGIVTNNFHVFRGVRLAKHSGIKQVQGIAAGNNPFYLPNNMLREYFGVLKDLPAIIK